MERRNPVLVSSGDPLFYGVARYLCDRLGKESFEVLPHVSSMQLAFARVKESWEDAYLTNLAGRPIEAVIDRIRTAEKVGLFSSDEFPPPRLARELLDRGIDYFRAYVCENLGSPDERVTQAELADLAAMEFNPLNVLILVRKPNRPDRASRAEPAPPLRQPRRRVRPDPAQARPDHPGGGPRHRPGPARHPRHQHGLGHRGRLGLGGHRGRPARPPGHGLRHRAGAGRHRADPGQRRVVRRAQRAHGAGPGPRSAGGLARARRGLRGRDRQAGRPGPQRGLSTGSAPAAAWRSTSRRSRAWPRPTRSSRAWRARSGSGTCAIARGIEQMDRLRFEAVAPTFLLAVSKRDQADD